MALPRAGRGYPRTVCEFRSFFRSQRRAGEWLVKRRWSSGWVCECGETLCWWRARGQIVCASCETSLVPTAGAILGETNIAATDWLQLCWELTKGALALGVGVRVRLGLWREYVSGPGARRCVTCRRMASPLAGAVFERVGVALTTWMEAGWAMSTATTGLSGLALERSHGLSREHAWTLLHLSAITTR